jgi:DNA-binding response OmpR family regulator
MSKKRILVCDDDQGVVEVIQIILEENGYEVRTLNSGKGIEKKIREFKPHLIFLDIWMPGIDGREITKLVKNGASTKDIPIIIVSALNDAEQISREIGADGYLPKPFDLSQLLIIVENHT